MAITAGSNLNSVPASIQQTLQTNYLDLASTAGQGWAQQYVPDLMEKEAEVFGPRTISGFLSQVGAEEAMTADQVVWSEQGRLHLSYLGHVHSTTGGADSSSQIDLISDIDGNTDIASGNHGVRVNDTVVISDPTNGVVKCLVVTVATDRIDVAPYGAAALSGTTSNSETTILVYGSEYPKASNYFVAAGNATTDTRGANEPSFKSFNNKPIIMKDYYEVSGSDASRIGWVEITSEEGASGYLWYLKAEADTRARFTDYIEMAMLEAEKGGVGNDITEESFVLGGDGSNDTTKNTGTEGLFAAIEDRGNLTSGITGVNAATDLAEFDKQGAIEENMMFVNRATSLAMDDMLASMNSYGAGGTSYGVFDNSEDMALNLGFSGFRRGSYDFYKSDFKYLNDKGTRGFINALDTTTGIRGVIIPAGVSTVYDQALGRNLKRPFLHVRFRASQMEDRRLKTWITGSVGGNVTSDLDAMEVNYLSERCLVVQGANNFMLLK